MDVGEGWADIDLPAKHRDLARRGRLYRPQLDSARSLTLPAAGLGLQPAGCLTGTFRRLHGYSARIIAFMVTRV